MPVVTVYVWEKFDIKVGDYVRSGNLATRDTIARFSDARIIEDSALEVERSALDGNGFVVMCTEG